MELDEENLRALKGDFNRLFNARGKAKYTPLVAGKTADAVQFVRFNFGYDFPIVINDMPPHVSHVGAETIEQLYEYVIHNQYEKYRFHGKLAHFKGREWIFIRGE